jgi:hypothetical protein
MPWGTLDMICIFASLMAVNIFFFFELNLSLVDRDLEQLVTCLHLPSVSSSCLVNMQAISSQLACQDEKILIICINSLSKVISPTEFRLRQSYICHVCKPIRS